MHFDARHATGIASQRHLSTDALYHADGIAQQHLGPDGPPKPPHVARMTRKTVDAIGDQCVASSLAVGDKMCEVAGVTTV